MSWQPIETAPKGQEILVYSPLNGGFISVEDWGKYCKYNSPMWTHWMPLPEPPEVEK